SRPPRDAAIETPETRVPSRVPVAQPREIRRRHEHAEPAEVLEVEVAAKRPIEFTRPVVARPDRALVHADGHDAAREPHRRPRNTAAAQVMRDLPRANAAVHCEHERAAGPEQPCAFARDAY